MPGKYVFKNFFMAFLCFLFILCLSVTLTVLFRPVYYWDVEHLRIGEQYGIAPEICRSNYDVLIDYNLIWGPDRLEFPDFRMSESGRIHFEEVKAIFAVCQYAAALGGIIFIGRILWQRKHNDRDYRWLRWTGWMALVFAAAVGGLVAVNWDLAFVLMHKLLFHNDFWLFDWRTDPIILILPDAFFLHCGILILILVIVSVLCCSLMAHKLE